MSENDARKNANDKPPSFDGLIKGAIFVALLLAPLLHFVAELTWGISFFAAGVIAVFIAGGMILRYGGDEFLQWLERKLKRK